MTSRDYFNAVLNAHISDEMDAASTEFIARLDARNEKRKSTETKDKREARERQRIVLNYLCDHQGVQYTRDQIAEALGKGILTPNFENEYQRVGRALQALL